MTIPSIHTADIQGKRVLVRADFDVELGQKRLEYDIRITAHKATFLFILNHGGLLRILTHNGRPGGKYVKRMSVQLLSRYIERMTKRRVLFISNPLDPTVFSRYNRSKDIILYENIRFWPGEEQNSLTFGKKIAAWGDFYVNEAFANCHRKHASVHALARILPSYAGIHLTEEISILTRLLQMPPRPFVAVLGGAKLETKLPLIRRFLKKADSVLIGGALANTLFALRGMETGKSKITEEQKDKKGLSNLKHQKLILPLDVVVSRSIHGKNPSYRLCKANEVKKYEYIVDLGPETVRLFIEKAKKAQSLIWNGPLGYYEIDKFAASTRAFAKELASVSALKVVGGGNSLASLSALGLLSSFTHVSTGGGAMLEFLSGKKLPGIEVLKHKL